MIPNKNNHKIKEKEIQNLINFQQSNKVKRKNNYTRITYKGTCLACKRKNINLAKIKYPLCARCFFWIKAKMRNKYGYYNEKFIAEGLIEFNKPVKCRFYDICGNTMNRIDENGNLIKEQSALCNNCRKIYKLGVEKGLKKVRKRRI